MLTFRNAWNFEAGYDGGIPNCPPMAAPAYNDVTSGGRRFIPAVIRAILHQPTTGSPMAGQSAWTVQTTIRHHHPAAAGLAPTVRPFACASAAAWDNGTVNAGANWRIDGLSIQSGLTCPGPGTGTCGGLTLPATCGAACRWPGTVSCTVNPVPSGRHSHLHGDRRSRLHSPTGPVDCTGPPARLTNVTRIARASRPTSLRCRSSTSTTAMHRMSTAPPTMGLLLMRYLLGTRGTALTQVACWACRQVQCGADCPPIATYLTLFDVDGDGSTLAATDGLLVVRRLLGLSGRRLRGRERPVRTDTDITNAIDRLKP